MHFGQLSPPILPNSKDQSQDQNGHSQLHLPLLNKITKFNCTRGLTDPKVALKDQFLRLAGSCLDCYVCFFQHWQKSDHN